MRKAICLLLTILMVTLGCNQNSLRQQLVEIDSLSTNKEDQKALEHLDKITPETIEDEECLAYYWFLRIRTSIRLSKDIHSVKPLDDICIPYYKRINDNEKLAKVYFDKAYILYKLNKQKNACIALKEAEALIKNNEKEIGLANHIYHNLAVINFKAKEEELFLKYSNLALKTAYQLNEPVEIAHSLLEMYSAYKSLGNMDSAQFYLDKCIPLVENLPDKNKVTFYNNIGISLVDKDTQKAEAYFNKALTIAPTAYTYRGLARVYYIKGERDKTEDMWKNALQTSDLYLKVEILQAQYESLQEEENYKAACNIAMQITAIKDSIAAKQREEDIKGLQDRFEQEQQAGEKQKQNAIWFFIIISLLFLFCTATLYLSYRNVKVKKQHEETRQMLEKYRNELKTIQQEGKADAQKVELLTQKISDLQKKQNALLQNGREHYEEIMAGGTTLRWNRNDFTDCVEYYRTIDAAFIAHMEIDYRQLSSKYIFFAVLEHIGKNDEQLQHIMVISQSTVRSIRSRIHSSSKNEL